MRRLAFVALLCALTLPACSFLGLDDIPVTECSLDSECTDLSESVPPPDDCQSWQCNPETRRCELDLLDGDADGHPRMLSPSMATCAMGANVDCDDAVATTSPSDAETCNGVDDDCSGLIDDDESALGITETCEAGETGEAVRDLVVRPRNEGGFAVADILAATMTGAYLVSLDADGDRAETSITANPAVAAVNTFLDLDFVRAGQWAAVRRAGGSCTSPFVQRLSTTTMTLAGDRVAGALPRPDGTVCTTSSLGAGELLTQLASIAVDASGDGEGIVAYLEDGAVSSCSGTATAQSLDVFVSLVSLPATGDFTVDPVPVSLGIAGGPGAPALLALEDDRYLAAIARTGGTIEVVAIDTASGDPVVTSVYTEDVGGTASNLSLTRGPEDTYAIAYDFVCPRGAFARVIEWSGSASATMGPALADMRAAARTPRVAYQVALDEWLLVSVTASGLEGVRFTPEGEAFGEPFGVVVATGDIPLSVQALGRGSAYRVISMRDPAPVPPDDVPMCPSITALGCLPGE